jgi:hypothetical protein
VQDSAGTVPDSAKYRGQCRIMQNMEDNAEKCRKCRIWRTMQEVQNIEDNAGQCRI